MCYYIQHRKGGDKMEEIIGSLIALWFIFVRDTHQEKSGKPYVAMGNHGHVTFYKDANGVTCWKRN
jgi:hypothetical protein